MENVEKNTKKNANEVSNQNTLESLTVRLTAEEKEQICQEAENLDISVSELIRIKALTKHSRIFLLIKENNELKQKIREQQIKLLYYDEIPIPEEGVFIKMTKEEQKFFEDLVTYIHSDNDGFEFGRIEDHFCRYIIEQLFEKKKYINRYNEKQIECESELGEAIFGEYMNRLYKINESDYEDEE